MKIKDMREILGQKQKEVKEMLNDNVKYHELIDYISCNFKEKPVVRMGFIKDREYKIIDYCYACGHTEENLRSAKITCCPICGNTDIRAIDDGTKSVATFSMVVDATEEYGVICTLDVLEGYTEKDNPLSVEDAVRNSKREIVLNKNSMSFYMLSFSNGLKRLYIDSYTGKMSLSNVTSIYSFHRNNIYYKDDHYNDFICRLKDNISFSDETPLFDVINAVAEDIEYTRKKKVSTSKSKVTKEETLKDLAAASFPDLTAMIKNKIIEFGTMPCVKISETPFSRDMISVCPCCGEINKTTMKECSEYRQTEVPVTCDNCKKEYKFNFSWYYSGTRYSSFRFTHWSNYKDFLVVRIFDASVELTEDKPNDFALKYEIAENTKIFIDSKNIYFYSYCKWKKKWDFISAGSFYERPITSDIAIQTDEELISVIKNSPARYSGVLDAWGLGLDKSLKIEEPSTFGRVAYLYSWHKKRFLELLLKSGFKKSVKTILSYKKLSEDIANPKGSTILSVLDINRPMLKIAQKSSASLSDIKKIRELWNADNTMSFEDYEFIKKTGKEESFTKIKTEFNISFSKQIEYIRSCFDFQCIAYSDSINLWVDYLSFAKEIGYNLKNRDIKYPSSLKRAHDIALFVKNSIKKNYDKTAFCKRTKENERFNYSLKSLGLTVFSPKKAEDIINEGMILHHCVSNYVNAVIEGRSIVMFIRKDDDEETPYYTAEVICDGVSAKITQVKGNMNTNPDPSTSEGKKVLDFVEKWAKFKKMTVSL